MHLTAVSLLPEVSDRPDMEKNSLRKSQESCCFRFVFAKTPFVTSSIPVAALPRALGSADDFLQWETWTQEQGSLLSYLLTV